MSSEHYVSRGGEKLAYALDAFKVIITGATCADLGCSTGGFTDCLLQRGAKKVYAVDTAYGVLDWKLRNDVRVIVMERTNALYVEIPELVDVVTIDAGWTRQGKIIPKALALLKSSGAIVTLVKPHYEATPKQLVSGRVPDEALQQVLAKVKSDLAALGVRVKAEVESPIVGGKGGNREFLFLISQTA